MNYQHLLVTTDGAIATVTLNRPEKRNVGRKRALEMASSAMTPDAQEGMRAFLEKRGAVYTQRFPGS